MTPEAAARSLTLTAFSSNSGSLNDLAAALTVCCWIEDSVPGSIPEQEAIATSATPIVRAAWPCCLAISSALNRHGCAETACAFRRLPTPSAGVAPSQRSPTPFGADLAMARTLPGRHLAREVPVPASTETEIR